ncbi:Cobalt-zinc-cadmium resistance protein czcA (plasmid) [Roseomonas mucosa]|uniref:efflux RND transporter permease subunit n=1 Tax=Roseomonas mucosa TaxID=207340 RepID=UPI000DB67CCF|nr:CusA/CzcA family heavy metal efflux RND transporter [Roseomonas mucosa]PZP46057.1 MAG: CusA/CzcA family heavy metal efflux RND transporter [Azospirillum brasilense]QDD92793.1 Cobalt-zinc-cadmium resistance protein czcA [Roseomonas mucosa]
MIGPILDFSVRNRWTVVLLAVVAACIGAFALLRLPIDATPDITNNQAQINTLAPSLSPYEIEKQVTFPIETALAGIPGLESTRSISRNGFSQVTAVFTESTNIYFARQQVLERLIEAREAMPEGVEPRLGPVSTGLGEVTMWTVNFAPRRQGDTVPDGQPGWQADGTYLTPERERLVTDADRATYLRTVQDWIIRPLIRNVPGVAGVDAIGGYTKQYVVQPDPARLIALGLGFSDLATAIERNNVSTGAGYVERGGEGLVVRSGGRVTSVAELEGIVVAAREGVPILLRDVGRVTIGQAQRTGSASGNGQEMVVGTALMLLGENSRTVAAAVHAKVDELRRTLPRGIEAVAVLDRGVLVDATIHTVAKNLGEGALLVVVILFLMLGNIRAAIITALVIPVTMLMTAFGMVRGGISANLMSLGALDFGLIVDGAVIITENSLRHLSERQHEKGRLLTLEERLRTVADSAKEMIRPSLYGQAIIILVYAPLLTFTGVEGKMFIPMAMTVIIALACAFVLSLTLVPALIAIWIAGRVQEKDVAIVRGMKRAYAPALGGALRAPLPVIAVGALLFLGSLTLFSRLGQEFIPTLDEGNLAMQALRIPSTSLQQSQAMQSVLERRISRLPEVQVIYSKTGTAEVASDPMPPNASDTFIILRPRDQWPDPSLPKEELVQRIEAAVAGIPGNALEFSQPIQMRFNELLAGVRGDLAVKVYGDEFGPMLQVAGQVAAILNGIEGAEDVKVEQATGLPFLEITVNRAEVARRGLSVADVQAVIAAAVGGREAGTVYEGDRRFAIVVRLPDAQRGNLETLRGLPVPLPPATGRPAASVPLQQLAAFRVVEGPNQISREQGRRRVVVQANARGRDIGSIVAEAQALVAERVQLPPGYALTWGGQFENLAKARERLSVVVPACFLLIMVLLYAALGSVRDAALVFSGVPLALSGGLLALWLRDMPFSVPAAVGFIALSGVAVLNGLVMATSIRALMEQGHLSLRDAVYQGAMTRLRPVAMTALVASLGFVPMALATGAGAEVQKPLATVVIGGLISATLLTLLVLPALYVRFGRVRADAGKEVAPAGTAHAPAE